MKNELIKTVVIKGDKAYAIEEDRKLVRNPQPTVTQTESAEKRILKKEYPHATIREYSDGRLSNYHKAAVDRFTGASSKSPDTGGLAHSGSQSAFRATTG